MSERDRACERHGELFESYLDGELDGAARVALEAHVAGCAGCSGELELARQVWRGLRSLPRLEAPAAAVHAVLARAREESDRASGRGWSWWILPRPAAIAAAAAILLLVAFITIHLRGRQEGPQIALDDPAVVRATLETKLALAHFADANRKVGQGLGRDLLHQRALAPIGRSVSESLDRRTDGDDPGVGPMPERG